MLFKWYSSFLYVLKAVRGAAFATFVATGQTCIMGARVLVQKSVYDQFMTKLTEKASRIHMGDPMDMNTQVLYPT